MTTPHGEAVFVFGSVAMKRGGVTRTILARMRLYAQAGIKVRLLLTEHGLREDAEEAAVRRAWSLPASVDVHYFWREAAPGGGGTEPPPSEDAVAEPGLVPLAEETSTGTVLRYFRDGVLVKTEYRDPLGKLRRVEHHDPARRVVSQESFDPNGRLVRIDELHPRTEATSVRRWFDRSGQCWLATYLTNQGRPVDAVRLRPSVHAYPDYGHCIAEWVDEVLKHSVNPVVFSDTRPLDPVLPAMRHPTARKVAVMHNCHTSKPYGAGDELKDSWAPLLENADAFDTIVALTHRQADDIAERFGAKNLTVINHPMHPQREPKVERTPGRLVAVARLDPQKRLDHAVKAFAKAAERIPHARFDIYGTGANATKLRILVDDLGLSGKVRIRGFTDQPLEKFAGATAAVLSSWFEGMPLVLCEAMGLGTPFVAYDINYGPSEVIRDGVDGLLVRPGDIDGLAEALTRLLGDVDYAAKLGERAREVVERFSEERWAHAWLDLFSSVSDLS